MKRLLFALSIFSLFVAACATPAGPVVVEVTPTSPPPTAVPLTAVPTTPTHIPVDLPPAQRAAIAALAAQLGIPADQITLVSSEAATWKDGCLGVVRMGVMCIRGPVQGFQIILTANGKQYEYHTNQEGSVLVDATGKPTQAPEGTPTTEPDVTPTHIPVDIPPVQRKAIEAAIRALGLPADQVKLVSIEAVDWPNGCLGVTHMGVMCTQNVVPGFRIILEANGKQYEFHTSLDASAVAPANGPAVEVPAAIVAIVRPMLASALGMADSAITVVSTQIIEWPDNCLGNNVPGTACGQVVTPGWLVTLAANGQQYEYHTNGDASVVKPGSLAVSWQRSGGIAGFNDNLLVYVSGEIHGSWAAGNKDSKLSTLTADQQAQLQGWLTKFGTVSVNHQDPANASDRMSVSFTLIGSGSAQPTEAEQQAMLDWSQRTLSGLEK